MATDNDLLTEQSRLLASINRTLETQIEFLEDISNRMSKQSVVSQEATSAMNDFAASNDTATQSLAGTGDVLSEIDGYWESFTSKVKNFIGEGLWENIAGPFNDALTLLGINFQSLSSIITNPVAAAFGFLTNAYNIIIEKASEYAHEQDKLLNAFEKVRDKFGSFNEDTSRRIKTSYNQFSGALNEAAGSSKTFASKFNVGIDGAVERLEKISELAEDLGPTFQALGQQFNDATAQLYVLKDGLNFTSDGLQQVARLSILNGKSLKQFSQEIMASVDKIGRQFNISTKALGADVGKALSNFKMLGRMTGDYVKEITKAAVFTRKLGIELNELTGIVDKFDEFEGGAEAAASLAQSFGMVIDPLKMMGMEAGPRLQELQRAFMSTGRSIDSMSRQERKLLADTAGLSEEQAMLAFSAKGLSLSYDEISAGADEATKKQRTNEQVMRDLADNIENFIRPLVEFSGFIQAFINGFGRGLVGTKEWTNLMGSLAQSLRQVAHLGEETGRIFSKLFFKSDTAAPLLNMLGNVSKMFVGISTTIRDFTEVLGSGSANIPELVSQLLEGIYTQIEEAFSDSASGFDIGSMAANFGVTMISILTGAVKFFTTRIKSWTEDLKKVVVDKSPKGVVGGIKEALFSLIDAIPALTEAIIPFGEALINKFGELIGEFPIAELFLTGGPLMVALSGITSGFFKELSKMFENVGAEAGSVESAAGGAAGGGVTSGIMSYITGASEQVAQAGQGLLDRLFNIVEEPAKLAAMAAAIAGSLSVLAIGVRNALLVFTDPIPGSADNKSMMDVIADTATKFDQVPLSGILKMGLVFAALFAGLGALMFGIYTATQSISKNPGLLLLLPGAAAVAAGLYLVPALGSMAGGIMGSIIGGLGSVIGEIGSSLDQQKLSEKIAGFPDIPDISKVSSALTSLSSIMVEVKKMTDAAPTGWFGTVDFTSYKESITKFVDFLADYGLIHQLERIPKTTNLSDQQSTSLNVVANLIVPVKKVIGSLNEMVGISEGLTQEKIDSIFTNLDHYVEKLESTSNTITQKKLSSFQERLVAVVGHTTMIRSILETLGEISLDATIDKMEANMNVAKTTMTVNGGAVNVNVKLNVTMNAEKMAAALVMGGYVSGNEDFNNYLQSNDGVGEYYENPGKGYKYGGAKTPTTGPNAIRTP